MTHRNLSPKAILLVALAALTTLAIPPRAEATAPFTSKVAVASQYATLQAAIVAAGEGGTVIVDQAYNFPGPLVLPSRFRMIGTGTQGDAVLVFSQLAGSGITIAPPALGGPAGWVEIESLDIEGLFIPGNGVVTTTRGIDLSNAHNITLRNLTVRGFDIGIFGAGSQSVRVENSNVSVNRTDNYQLTGESTSWRIHGGISRFAGRHGIAVLGGNDAVIDGVVLESNSGAGVFTDTLGTHVSHSRFECWVDPQHPFCLATTNAVRIGPGGRETTLVDNLYAGIGVLDQSAEHSTYRFDNGFPVELGPAVGTDPLRIRFAGQADPAFLVDGTGKVRIGPPSGVAARFTINGQNGESPLRIRNDGVTTVYIGGNGRVGLGTASPTERLQVQGNLKLNGNLVSDGEICIGSGC